MTTIQVTEKDIKHGRSGSCEGCPIALAVERHFGPCAVGSHTVRIINKDCNIASLPKIARRFIRLFDSNEKVMPFEFEIDLVEFKD